MYIDLWVILCSTYLFKYLHCRAFVPTFICPAVVENAVNAVLDGCWWWFPVFCCCSNGLPSHAYVDPKASCKMWACIHAASQRAAGVWKQTNTEDAYESIAAGVKKLTAPVCVSKQSTSSWPARARVDLQIWLYHAITIREYIEQVSGDDGTQAFKGCTRNRREPT